MLKELEFEKLNIEMVRDLAKVFWQFFDHPSQQIKYRKEMNSFIETLGLAIISYWGEGSTITIDKCHKKFECRGVDGRCLCV